MAKLKGKPAVIRLKPTLIVRGSTKTPRAFRRRDPPFVPPQADAQPLHKKP